MASVRTGLLSHCKRPATPVSAAVAGGWDTAAAPQITPSIAVEFDTHDNNVANGDPNGNHAGIDLNGSTNSVATAIEPVRFNDDQIWNAWVDYDGSTLEARWSLNAARPVAAQLSAVEDLSAILGQSTAFVGFTAGTGLGFETHDILNWTFADSYAPIAPVPEPVMHVWGAAVGAVALSSRVRSRFSRKRHSP